MSQKPSQVPFQPRGSHGQEAAVAAPDRLLPAGGYRPTLGGYRDTAFGPAFVVAVGLVLLLFAFLPVGWLEEHWFRSRPLGFFDSDPKHIDLPREIRIVEVLREDGSAPSSALDPVVHILREPSEPIPEPIPETPESGLDEASPDWSFDPSTPYAVGREALLHSRDDEPSISLTTHLQALQARHSAHVLLSSAAYVTFAVASVRHTFRLQDMQTKQRLGPGWMEEMRNRRMQDYWERYIMSDGNN